MQWTDAHIETLRRLWSEGLSAGQIAARLEGATRNAVLGKLSRLKLLGSRLAASPPGRTPLASVLTVPASTSCRPFTPIAPAAPEWPLLDVPETAFAPLPGAAPRPWLTREAGECAFPAGGDGAGLLSCCAPVAAQSAYCAAHHARVYRREAPAARRESERLWAELARRCAA